MTLQGTVSVGTDEDGDPSYELTSGGKTYRARGRTAWYYGDNHPLKPFVGQSVTVTGEAAEGSTDVDVLTVDGTAIREPGCRRGRAAGSRSGAPPGLVGGEGRALGREGREAAAEVRWLLAARPLQGAGRSRVRVAPTHQVSFPSTLLTRTDIGVSPSSPAWGRRRL